MKAPRKGSTMTVHKKLDSQQCCLPCHWSHNKLGRWVSTNASLLTPESRKRCKTTLEAPFMETTQNDTVTDFRLIWLTTFWQIPATDRRRQGDKPSRLLDTPVRTWEVVLRHAEWLACSQTSTVNRQCLLIDSDCLSFVDLWKKGGIRQQKTVAWDTGPRNPDDSLKPSGQYT